MSETIYRQMAGVLEALPNGFPRTDTGIEIKIVPPPENEKEWYRKRARERGIDISRFTT